MRSFGPGIYLTLASGVLLVLAVILLLVRRGSEAERRRIYFGVAIAILGLGFGVYRLIMSG